MAQTHILSIDSFLASNINYKYTQKYVIKCMAMIPILNRPYMNQQIKPKKEEEKRYLGK
jgi:hypothetical protein